MQTQHGEVAEEAILSPERQFRARLLIDWNQDGGYSHSLSDIGHYVESVNVNSTLSGSAPEEVLLIEGAAAAELTAVLHGTIGDYALPAIFSPYNKRSPLYGNPMVGAEIRYELGVETDEGTFWYPQFVGNIRTLTPSRADATVTITALDRVEKLRRPVRFAPWAISEKHQNVDGATRAQRVNTTWVIDNCLRLSGVSQSPLRPARRDDLTTQDFSYDAPQLWVSGAGSWLPTIGWAAQRDNTPIPTIDGGNLQMYTRIGQPHPDAPTHMNGESAKPFAFTSIGGGSSHFAYWGADRDSLSAGDVTHIAFTAILNGSAQNNDYWKNNGDVTIAEVFPGGGIGIRVKNYGGDILCQVMKVVGWTNDWVPPTATLTQAEQVSTWHVSLPDDGRDHCRVHIAIDMGGSTGPVRAYLETDAGHTTGIHEIRPNGWWTGDAPNHAYKGYARIFPRLSLADFSWVGRGNDVLTPGINGGVPAEYAATLDTGLQELTHLPIRNGDDAWEVISSVAAAEFGSVFWDEHGVFRFWNYQTMLSKQSSVARTYSLDDLPELVITNTFDSVRNIWTTDMTKKVGIEGVVYEADSITEFHMPPSGHYQNDTTKVRVWSDNIITADPADLPKCTEDERSTSMKFWDDSVRHGYVPTFFKGNYHTGDHSDKEMWEEDPGLSQHAVNVFYDGSGSLVIQVWNSTNFPMRLATRTQKWDKETETTTEGQPVDETWTLDPSEYVEPKPAMRVGGQIVNELGSATSTISNSASRASIAMYGGRNFQVSGEWVQYGYNHDRTANTLMPRMLHPAPSTDNISVPGDPRLQKGDLIAIEDGSGFGSDIKLQILGIDRTFSLDEGLTDTLTVEMIQPVPLNLDPENPRPQITRVNLCRNPSLTVGNSDPQAMWWPPSGSGERRSTTQMPRDWALWTGTTGVTAMPYFSVQEGETYRVSVYVKGAGGNANGFCGIDWRDSDGEIMSSHTGNAWSVANGAVTRIDMGIAVAPAGAVSATPSVEALGSPVELTAALYEQTDQLRDFFDGDTPTATWDGGLRGYSTSRILSDDDQVGGPDSDSAALRYGWGAPDPSSDEFDGDEVDRDKWGVYGVGGDIEHGGSSGSTATDCWLGHDGNGRRCDYTCTVQDGYLRMTGYENGDTGGMSHRFDQRYGRWECRARMHVDPGATGHPYHALFIIWPESNRWPQDGEYDWVEIFNVKEDTLAAFLHYPHDPGQVQQIYVEHDQPVDLSEWHNYGFEWTSESLVGYIDGVEWFRVSGGARGPVGDNPARLNVQDMPSGHLTIQLDNFNYDTNGTSGMEKTYFDVAWARAYPLRALQPPPLESGDDGSLDPPTP